MLASNFKISDTGLQTVAGAPSIAWAKRLAKIINRLIIPRHPSGFTFNPRLEKCLALGLNTNPEIYVVSIKGHELRLPRVPTEPELARWIVSRWHLLLRESNFIGGWPHLANYFVDVSVLISGKADAESFARRQDQLSIYHPASGQSLEVTF